MTYKGFRTSDPQRDVMGQDVTICFYALLDIHKTLEIFNLIV